MTATLPSGLTRSQRDAVRNPGHIALVSCPGSGKTRTLVAKLVRCVEEAHETTRLIACITYTNAAVYEIEARLDALGVQAAEYKCDIETIHSFCLKHIIVPHGWRLPDFRSGFRVLPTDDPYYSELVARIVSEHGLRSIAVEQFEQLGRGTGTIPDALTWDAAEEFWAELDRQHLMDFSSIIYWASVLVRDVPHIARGLASRYRWILVDEFQDTSSLQVDILREIHGHDRTVFFLVGDPFQSIMSFAGARPALLDEFGATVGARLDVQLLENFRSSKKVLGLADRLCSRGAPMVAVGKHRDFHVEPEWHGVESMVEGIATLFLPAMAEHGIALADSAILANRWTSLLPLSRGLRDRAVPVVGPGARPYKRSTHIIAPLMEELAACIAEPTARGVRMIRREMRRLVQTVSPASPSDLGFPGDVTAARILGRTRSLSAPESPAEDFLLDAAMIVANELLQSGFLLSSQAEAIAATGQALVADIRKHEIDYSLRTTTVRDLGIFARGTESIRLLTMHGSKGREFDAVALVDVFDGHVPYYTCTPGDEIEAEGRRLLYVAITRAKRLLMIFTLGRPTERKLPSRFLELLFPRGPRLQSQDTAPDDDDVPF